MVGRDQLLFALREQDFGKGERGTNTALVLVELLKEYGVEYIFGVPGDTSMVFYDALYAAQGQITHARPDERIVGLVGDGSFGMAGMELATLASLQLPITIILFNNGSFGWIKMLQRLYHSQRYLGVDFTAPMDAVAIAEAFGIHGVRITHPHQLVPALRDALESNAPVFIDVPTRSELDEVPPVHAWQQALAEDKVP